jgi:hypothetical protein
VRAFVTSPLAQWLQQLHPLRLQYELFSDANAMMAAVGPMADQVREHRRPARVDNPFLAFQEAASKHIVATLDAWRDTSEMLAERLFLSVYGSPALQAAAGIDPGSTRPLRKAARNPLHQELLGKRVAELRANIPKGGLREAVIRGLLYAGMARAAVDERGFEAVRRIREAYSELSLTAFKSLVREQFNMLLIDQAAALAAIPSMLPLDAEMRRKGFSLIEQVMSARGELSAADKSALDEVARLFDPGDDGAVAHRVAVLPAARKELKSPSEAHAKAS